MISNSIKVFWKYNISITFILFSVYLMNYFVFQLCMEWEKEVKILLLYKLK